MFTRFFHIDESNILQVYFPKTTRKVFGVPFSVLALNCNKVSVSLSQEAPICKNLDLSNVNFQGLFELASLMIQKNLGCFVPDTYVVYLEESITLLVQGPYHF